LQYCDVTVRRYSSTNSECPPIRLDLSTEISTA
jgi:hypothetical protein